MMNKTKPFLKWAGGKFRCLETILASLPPGNRLIEPFTGSGAIFVNSSYPDYLLAEGNQELISLFTILKQEGSTFIDFCARYFSMQYNCAEQYYRLREQFNHSADPQEKAALFLYLNRHGYNGLCRFNNNGRYNVPFGRYHKPYFPRTEMTFFHQKSQRARFLHADFRDTFALAVPGDVIYCDPPYVPLSASANFSSYIDKRFNEEDQIELARLAMYWANKGITVIISNHDTDFTRYHYRHGEITSFPVKRLISCKSKQRHPVQELVAVFR
ncbi:DNA adenine methylase [Legionella spiritensis]|uniref:Site-specific DNA-methyltransferase (adenine-specific) n=2 Tax=Legionella spiritensis TaxID=452 RepID=A0A0W0Z7Z4_LEGSP|nr:DNA adenine methylase [Legionella spiritensis]SNV30263.1 DNA adenine methylase [Legionella spiritensis]